MELNRKPFQGITNIVRFNWHFYLMAFVVITVLLLFKNHFSPQTQTILSIVIGIAIFALLVSLCVSFYIYDLSGLYQLKWIKNLNGKKTLNINAGFDETSAIITAKFPKTDLTICDFYNPKKHTEISIKRARRAYPPHPKTIFVTTDKLPFSDNFFNTALVILSAHEIRSKNEKVYFFRELGRITKKQIYVTEHLLDFSNFMAYSLGAFHFYSRKSWIKSFEQAHLTITNEIKTTPFITTFVLKKHGNTN
ncbi:MAG: methyltransferase [Flavobacteriaceae bacterium]